MISAISWVPKGVSKSEPVVADPPPEEEIQEIIASHTTKRWSFCLLLTKFSSNIIKPQHPIFYVQWRQ